MRIKPTVGSVVGPTSNAHWSQVLQMPGAYGLVEVFSADKPAREKGVAVLTELERVLAEPPVSLKTLAACVDRIFCDGIQTLCIAVPVGTVAYIILRGVGAVYCKRGREFAKLLEESGEISGEVKIGDTFIFVSSEFTKAVSPDTLMRTFDHKPPQEIAEQLTLLLHETDYGEGSAALVLQIQDDKDIPITDTTVSVLPPILRTHRPIHMRINPRDVIRFLRRLRSQPKKATAFLTAALLLLFGASVLLGVWKQSKIRGNQSVTQAIQDARHAFDEGVALLPLNPVKGRERLVLAKQLLETVKSSVPARSPDGIAVADLYRQISDNLTSAMQEYSVTPGLFFDASLVKKGAKIYCIGFEDLTVGITDETTQTVYALNIQSKNAQIVGGGQLYPKLSYITVHGNHMYILTQSGIHEIDITVNKTYPDVVKSNEKWGTIRALVSFGGNLYLLDTQNSRIWKYVATDNGQPAGRQGFSDIREYLNPDTLPDLTRAESLAIDGSVWIGTADGKILKFTQGKTDAFTPQGVTPQLGENLWVYTSDVTANLYVLDSQNKRVVVLAKDGTYLSQYVWKETVIPTQIAVSETAKKIFLVASGQLYAIDMH